MTLANTAFIVFLALKNTPLAFLTYYSYERLNLLHQVGGYATIAYALLHVITSCVAFGKIHRNAMLLEQKQIHAIEATVALVVSLIFAVLIRRIRYEVFYVSHISMYIIFIINIALHQPIMAEKVVYITI